ncbi:polymer-forming cytoskeletal protein [Ideonella sp.]|uniref:bactofilin family protein n=1 Tax=Ideonella sp. TaxID=1929293 RepID=UPI002B4A42AD|nr:polymer-forming cytoskeletal protein [Ideonella sp.]HJV68816.1 polymer-forming cytoskeletal protein [Ideonella sp.]
MNGQDNQRAPARLVPAEQLNNISSLVAEGAQFEGTFSAKADLGLKVDGMLKGDIRLENGGTVHVGATGIVEGTTIEADHVLIEGKVRGTVIARKTLEITGSATLMGDAMYDALLDVHPRARLRGKIEFRGEMDLAEE